MGWLKNLYVPYDDEEVRQLITDNVNAINNLRLNGVKLKGAFNESTITSPQVGDMWFATSSGTLLSGATYNGGDMIIYYANSLYVLDVGSLSDYSIRRQ